jgi:hypothetical protein
VNASLLPPSLVSADRPRTCVKLQTPVSENRLGPHRVCSLSDLFRFILTSKILLSQKVRVVECGILRRIGSLTLESHHPNQVVAGTPPHRQVIDSNINLGSDLFQGANCARILLHIRSHDQNPSLDSDPPSTSTDSIFTLMSPG